MRKHPDSNSNLGFSCTPQNGKRGETPQFSAQIQEECKEPGRSKDHIALLVIFTGKDGNDPNCCSLTVETCTQGPHFSDPDDVGAVAKMSARFANSLNAKPSSNKVDVLSGQKSCISVFAVENDAVRKAAVV